MGHLSILVWIKVHHSQKVFTVLEFPVYTLFDQKHNLKFFWKGQKRERRKGIRTHSLQICNQRSNSMHYALGKQIRKRKKI